MLHPVLKDDVSSFAVIFNEDTPLELRCIFESTFSDDLSCKHEMEDIIGYK